MIQEDHFHAMGTDIDVMVADGQPPLDAFISVHLLFEQQEQRFSRFRADSLLSQLNAGATVVDATFAAVCRLALTANEDTDGLFNPLVLPALVVAGYDKTFDDVSGGRPEAVNIPMLPECLTIHGDEVRLLSGAMDLGGIVKGWTVDQAIDLLSPDHPNLLVNAGGDLRVAGGDDEHDGWEMGVADPRLPDTFAWRGTMTAALATSTTLKRRWTTDSGGTAHHLIDPRTGLPSDSGLVQVSVWAKETWWAEVWAKAILIGGPSVAERAQRAGCEALILEHSST